MDIPIYIDGKQEGKLTIERQGAVTVMRVDMNDVGRVVRLTVFGEKTGYLGVPEPKDGRLYLERRFSPMDMLRFPQRMEYAADRPMEKSAPAPQPIQKEPEDDPGQHILWMGGKPHYF